MSNTFSEEKILSAVDAADAEPRENEQDADQETENKLFEEEADVDSENDELDEETDEHSDEIEEA